MDELISTQELGKLELLPRDELLKYVKYYDTSTKLYQNKINQLEKQVAGLNERLGINQTERLNIGDQLVILKNEIFGASSERRKKIADHPFSEKKGKRKTKVQLPSERNPGLDLIVQELGLKNPPRCKCCNEEMVPMGQSENSEFVTVITRKFHVMEQKRMKYRCSKCHGSIVTTPAPKRLVEGGSYSTEFAVDVAVDKYAFHVPIERQVEKMASQGLNVEHQTLIEQTHALADALTPVYNDIKREVEDQKVLQADETTWRMLEGDEKKSWWIWGFFGKKSAFYEPHDTRSGEVANRILKNSRAQYLMVDGYTGYHKPSIKAGIKVANCWAHARRKFIEAADNYPECNEMLDLIGDLYKVERESSEPERLARRKTESKPIIDKIQKWLFSKRPLPKSSFGKAVDYTGKYWEGLTRFLEDPDIPLDNNLSERGLRNPVLGRKNFYGNHSRRGATTTATLYSVIESCKLNKIDPYKYLLTTVNNIINGNPFQTPANFTEK